MKVFKEIGSKDRFVEVFQKVNKVSINEAFGQALDSNSVLVDAFNQLKSGNLSVKHSNTQANGNESYVELVCLDRENNNITFTFKATLSEGDQEGVFSIDNAAITSFSFDDAVGEDSVEMDENALRQFNAGHASEIADIVDEYVDVEEPVDADMDEQYRTAVERIDAVPYKAGSERMVQQKQYGDEKPTNPALRAGDEFNKFVKEEMDDMFNPEEIETGFQKPDMYTDVEEPVEPEIDEPIEEVPEEKKKIILQAYDNLMERAKQQRKFNYSPTHLEVEDEILRITGQKVVKEKTRVFPKEAEPWLEEGNATITPTAYSEKMLSPEKKREYIEKAKDFLETNLGAERFFGLQGEERNMLIAQIANQIFMAELSMMNEEDEKGEYPDQIGKKFKPKSHYPKKKKKPQTTVNISETEGEKLIKQNYTTLHADMDFGKLAGAYQGLLKLRRGEFRSSGIVQQALSTLRNAITTYLNTVKGIQVSDQDVQNYFENMGSKYSSVAENEMDVEVPELEIPADSGSEKQAKSDISKEYPGMKKVPFDTDFSMNEKSDDGMSLEPETDEIEKIAQEKEETGDVIPGGKADGKSPLEFPADQVKMGLGVEKEHTDDPLVAVEIATDHLEEFPDYYTRLDKMEKQAKEDKGEDKNMKESDDEMADILLGYQPKNVGEQFDYAGAEVDYENKDAHQKYLQYAEKDFDSLSDDEKEDYFELWKQFKGVEKENESVLNEYNDVPEGHASPEQKKIMIAQLKKHFGIHAADSSLFGGEGGVGFDMSEVSDVNMKELIGFLKALGWSIRENQGSADAYILYPDLMNENSAGEAQLSDFVDAPGSTEIWYAKKPSFDSWEMREKMYAEEPNWKNPMEYTKKYGPKIDTNNLEKTHALLGTIAETDPNKIFHILNNWGGEEVNVMLRKKGLSHTSMSVGDIIKIGNKVLFVDDYGFKELSSAPNNVNTTGDVTFGSSSITEAQVKKARLTLSNRNIPTGMTKKEAVQILIKNNTKTIL